MRYYVFIAPGSGRPVGKMYGTVGHKYEPMPNGGGALLLRVYHWGALVVKSI